MAEQGDDGLDRSAILARRRRFIALAISGLASGGCKTGPGPQPCLSIAHPMSPEGGEAEEAEEGAGEDSGREEPMPQPCLSIVPEDAEPGGGSEPPTDESSDDTPEPPPRPCLNMRMPEPRPGES